MQLCGVMQLRAGNVDLVEFVRPTDVIQSGSSSRLVKNWTILNLKLIREEQRSSLVIMADLVKLDLVRNRRCKPSAADNADLTPT
jgi:hypothetical protein